MKLSMGLQSKLLAMISIVTLASGAACFIVYEKFQVMVELQGRQAKSVSALSALKDLQTMVSVANLNAMDIIVDRQKVSGSEYKIDQERLEKLNQFRVFLTSKRNDYLTIAQPYGLEKSMDSALTLLMEVHQETTKMVAQFESGGNNFSEFDAIIDKQSTDANTLMNDMRVKFEEDFTHASALLKSVVESLLVWFLTLYIFSIAMLFALGLPTALSVGRAMKKIRQQLGAATKEIQFSSDSLANASQRMAGSATQAAAAIQESVSSMAEMTAMLGQTTQHTSATSTVAQEVLLQAQDGTHIMEEMSSSIHRIADANGRLQDIVKIIEDINAKTNIINEIVFKTQLLAVNASIEAARAGHHGKGFSVVANEVANLANLSGKAAAEIRSLLKASAGQVTEIIDHTSKTVHSGEQVSQQAVEAFNSIAKGISEISSKLIQINDAAKEQELGVRQTSTALTQMNEATAANSAAARENAGLGINLKTQVERLVSVGRAMNYVVIGVEQAGNGDNNDGHRMSRVDRILAGSLGESANVIPLHGYHESRHPDFHGSEESKQQLAASIMGKLMTARDGYPEDSSESQATNELGKHDQQRMAS